MRHYRKPNPKVVWKHDGWDLEYLYQRLKNDQYRARILLALKHIRAGISYSRTALILQEKRVNLTGWAKDYQKHGLKVLLGISTTIPIHIRKHIDRYMEKNPESKKKVLLTNNFSLYAKQIDVEYEMLTKWVMECYLKD